MRDPQFQFEASELSLGRTIYLFDKGSHNIRAFCSMICADALEAHFYENIHQKLRDRKLLVFHPQLNPDPYFADIIRYIDVYIDKQWSFLRLNWTPDTKLSGVPIRKPGTGYIYKADRNMEAYWNSPSDRRNYIQNRAKGLHFLMNKSLRAHWLFPPQSHAALYYLRHPKPLTNAAHTPHALTIGRLYYYELGVGWQMISNCPWPAFLTIIQSREQKVLDFLKKINCTNCNGDTCALLMADRFISMLRGIRDHEVINETPPDSHGNGCVTNIAGELLSKAQMEWRHADMIGAYLQDICQIAGATDEINLQALQYIVPDGVRIEVPTEMVQNRQTMYNVAGEGQSIGRFQRGLAVYTDQTNQHDLDKLQDDYSRLTTVEDLGVMLFYPDQADTVKLHPDIRWGQVSDIGPSGTVPKEKSNIGLGGI
jgi:hypothetical protein